MIKAVICSLDNLSLLKEQTHILRREPEIDEIVVINNGSQDGTNEWLYTQPDLVMVERENSGAGPGRNAGLDAAGDFDYVLMLDGGIRPLIDGVGHMLDYLERTPEADVLGVEIPDFETDKKKSWRRWPKPIENTYRNWRLSHTAYCLARRRAFDGLRFCEEGPFGQSGWGADDDEMCYRWNQAGIQIHVITCDCRYGKAHNGVHPYRRGSGSFRRLFLETGIWPNQYGSVYEQRVVWLQQNWPEYKPGIQWGEPWLTLVIEAGTIKETAIIIKTAHDRLRQRRFADPWSQAWNPYSLILWCPNGNDDVLKWAEPRCLRQHHGDTIIVDDQIIRRESDNESTWTGDFRLYRDDDWRQAIRPNSGYYNKLATMKGLEKVLECYDELHQPQGEENPPTVGAKAMT